MGVPQFIEFGERIVNTTRIVSIAPPRRTAEGYEIEARIDGFSHKETYGDLDEADERYDTLASVLLDLPLARRDAVEDPTRLRAMLATLAEG